MKKVLVSVVFMLAIGLTTALADDGAGVSKKVKESFKKEFAGAKPVRWENLGDYQMVIFVFDDHLVEAYFNNETGDLEGSARYLLFDQLPMAVIRSFDKNFSRSEFMSALEISNTEGSYYKVTVEVGGKRRTVKIDADGNMQQGVKIRK